MSITSGKPKAKRDIRVGEPDRIGKSLVEFIHSGSVLHRERFDVFNAKESGQAINRYLNIAGQKLEASTIDSIRLQIQQAVSAHETGKVIKSFSGIDASELKKFEHDEPDWLVDGILSADQPTVFGAASKATKTTQLIDLAVALATEKDWLGAFKIPKRRKTLLITGESNYRACSKRLARALNCRDLGWKDIAGWLHVEAIEFPVLPSVVHQDQIHQDVLQHGFEVVIVDPLYRGLTGIDTHRMSEVGSAIVAFTKAVQPASLIISHHVTKTSARDLSGPPSLEDLSGAGLAESCGNWWLLGRNELYKFDRIHDLVVQFGGRDEQSGIRRIVFNEADWSFEVTSLADLKHQKQRERDERKQQERQTRLNEARCRVKSVLGKAKQAKPKSWIEERTGLSQAITRAAIADLLTDGTLVESTYQDGKNRVQTGLMLQT